MNAYVGYRIGCTTLELMEFIGHVEVVGVLKEYYRMRERGTAIECIR